MEMRGLMGGFYRISEWIMRLSVINVLWVICSIPFFLLLLSTMFAQEATSQQLLTMLWTLAAIAPFTLVPATTAMFAVARKWIMGDEDVPLFKTYFRSYKDNYKQTMLGGLLFLIIGAVLIINFKFYSGRTDGLRYLGLFFLSSLIFFAASFINFLSLTVHFNMKLLHLIKNAFIMTFGHPFSTLAILITNGFILFLSSKFTFLIPFFVGSLCAVASFWYFFRSFQRVQDKLEKEREKQAELQSSEDTAQTEN